MRPKLYQAIEMAVASGVPTSMLADLLCQIGWPRAMVNQVVDEWVAKNASITQKTDFKTWLKKYQKKALPAVGLMVFLGIGQALFMLLKPWPTKIMADSALGTITAPGLLAPYTHTPKLILITSLMTLLIFVFGAAFSWVSDFLLLRIGFWLNRSIKAESFRHILHLPLYHQQRLAKGDYVYRQNVVTNSLADLVLSTTASIIGDIIMVIGVLCIMINFSVPLTLISVALMPLLYVTMHFIAPHLGKYSRQLTEINSKTASAINESVDNAETVQAFTLEEKQILRVDDLWHAGYRVTKANLMWSNLLKNSNMLLVIIATSIVMYYGGTAALRHEMTFGQLFIFMTYMGYLQWPVQDLVQRVTSRYQKKIDVGRVYEILSDHEGIENLRKERALPATIRGEIEFQSVSYDYQGQQVFKDLSLTVKPGEKVAIIGPSGSGKSTLLKLLPLFIEPTKGTILVDGIDIQSVSLEGLRQKIAWVSQTPQLFTGTILENIYDGDVYRQVSLDEIKHAVEVANVIEFTAKLPMGINSLAGENGSSLSGGQRQRVAIARSLIKNAPILCLDEPTAALDAKSENYIRDSLMQLVQNKTVLMVTHRKSLLALMDTIYVLEDGSLKNVEEYGGLETYLALLEGIQQQTIAKEIADEKWYNQAANVDKVGLQEAAKPVVRALHTTAAKKTGAETAQPAQVFTLEHTDEGFEDFSTKTREVVVESDKTWNPQEEVIINLHDR
ncbi:MAG: ABC transporter ATP-binding protein [Candidatus Saccharimonadales bacterium]